MGGIFRTFSNTWNITKTTMVVLRQGQRAALFPIMSFVGIAIVVGIAAAVFAVIGTFDRLDTTGEGAELKAGDVIVGVLALVAALFIVNYFNAALMAAARHRLRGGDPNVWTGLAAVNKNISGVLGWAIISAIILIILTYIRGKTNSFLGRILIDIVGAVWAYMTFFVVPILIVEGVGPIEAIKRSKNYFGRTWGEQLVSGFGFGIIRMIAMLPGIGLGLAIGATHPSRASSSPSRSSRSPSPSSTRSRASSRWPSTSTSPSTWSPSSSPRRFWTALTAAAARPPSAAPSCSSHRGC